MVAEDNREVIRYGENGVPNYVKGENLSAALDTEEAFQLLKAQKNMGKWHCTIWSDNDRCSG